ncbi:MAG TPA: tetratricopeptide repeat protein [Spirochaetia bacterium]|nr:tetratricopeptide repeat protein [Spirochaetia bacterium]
MTRRAAWVLGALLLVTPCFADTAADLLATGKKAFTDGLYPVAARSFQRILNEFPGSDGATEAEYLLGVAFFYSGDWASAQSTLLGFRTHHPGTALADRTSYWLGAASLKQGNYPAALGYLEQSLAPSGSGTPNPYRLQSLLLTGVAQESLGRDAEAAAAYRLLISDPGAGGLAPEAVFRLAGTAYRAGDFAGASDLYGRVVLSYPGSPFVADSLFFLGESLLSLGNLADAEQRYTTLLSLYPDSPYREAALFRLADIAWRGSRATDALARLDTLNQQFPAGAYRGSAYRLRGDILLSQQAYDLALNQYQGAVSLLPQGTERQSALYSMGIAQLMLGKREQAAQSFKAAQVGGSSDIARKAARQAALLDASDDAPDQGIPSLQSYVGGEDQGPGAQGPGAPIAQANGDARTLLASLQEQKGDYDGAAVTWSSLIERAPDPASLPEYLYRRAQDLLRAGRPSAALDDLQRVLRDYPSSAWSAQSSYAVGYAYSLSSEYARALPYFRSAATGAGTTATAAGAADVAARSRLAVGVCLFDMGDFPRALSSLQDLLANLPAGLPQATVVLYVGRTLYRMERLGEAAQTLGQAASLFAASPPRPAGEAGFLDPVGQAADAVYWQAWALFRLGRFAEARDAFLSIPTRFPSDTRAAEALLRAGICDTLSADDPDAVPLFDRVLASQASGIDDLREQALYEKGWALSRQGRSQDSAADFELLARRYPDGAFAPQAFLKLASTALENKRFADALAGFQRVAKDFPESVAAPRARYLIAETRLESGDAQGAADGFWASIVEGPQHRQDALDGFASAMSAASSVVLARQYASLASVRMDLPLEARAAVLLDCAEMLVSIAPDEALGIVTEVRKRPPPEPLSGEASLLLGMVYAAKADWQRALDIFAALSESRADVIGARALRERARALEATGDATDALDAALKISYLFPDQVDLAAEGMYNAARLAVARGDSALAAKIGQSLRAAYPDSPWIARLEALAGMPAGASKP